MPLRDAQYYIDRQIDLLLNGRVTAIDTARCVVSLDNGEQLAYGALLLATGADPIRLEIPLTAGAHDLLFAHPCR